MWNNLHTHSDYCDGKGELSKFVEQAIELNMKGLGFSSHAPLPFGCEWCMNENSLQRYISEIAMLRQANSGIEIYAGLESDYIPEVISPQQFRHQLDYVIGSIHFVEGYYKGSHWEIDGPYINFLQGLDEIFDNKIRDAISRYYELTREMITTAKPDIVGHLDKIKIQNINGKHFSEEEPWYRQEVLKTIDVIQKEGVIVEVNTRGMYQRKTSTTYPSPWILEILCERNMPITINSDAHHPDDLVNQFNATAEVLQKIGFKKLTTLHEGTWKHYTYSADGITFA
jgi:histidinol-phosphatase (PHP family)